jgi:hypothetical protein
LSRHLDGRAKEPVGLVARVLVSIGSYIFLTSIMQSLASLQGKRAGLSGLSLGLALALASGGTGALTDMLFAMTADRSGPRRVVRWGVLCALAASAILAVPGKVALLLGAFVFGLANSALGNPMLGWLGSLRQGRAQTRVQGLNGSVQRLGALLAAGVLGIAIALGSPLIMAVASAAVSLVAWLAVGRNGNVADAGAEPPAPPSGIGGWARGYWRGVGMLGGTGIALGALVSLAINIIFLETNSYIPLLQGPNRAAIVTSALAARDVVAIVVGIALARAGTDVSTAPIVAFSIAVAGLSTLAGGLGAGGAFFILWCALQGAVVGICIAATNLFTIGATSTHDRTVGMAASFFPARIMFLVLPLCCSEVLRLRGLPEVFDLLGGVLVLLAAGSLIVRSVAARRPGCQAVDD